MRSFSFVFLFFFSPHVLTNQNIVTILLRSDMLGGCLALKQKRSGVDSKYSCHSILENFIVITEQEKKLMDVPESLKDKIVFPFQNV